MQPVPACFVYKGTAMQGALLNIYAKMSAFNSRIFQTKSKLQIKKNYKILTNIKKATAKTAQAVVKASKIGANISAQAVSLAVSGKDTAEVHLRRLNRETVVPYLGLGVVAVFVFMGNIANERVLADQGYQSPITSDVSPETLQSVLTAIDPYTQGLSEDPTLVASIAASEEESYITRPDATDMTVAEQESKKDPIPYVVANGDTMLSIAKAHGRTVATILEANNIKPADAGKIKPGTTLLIPQEDTSDSMEWLAEDQKAKAEAAKKLADAKAAAAAAKQKALAAAAKAKASTTSKETSSESYDGSGDAANFVVPIHYTVIARGVGRGHMGIDYDAPVGTAVVAAASGRVVEITHGWAGGFGNSVVIDHGNGLKTRYAHLSQAQVSVGQVVSQGEQIALSGNTGNSTGPHLHFETRINGRVISPF